MPDPCPGCQDRYACGPYPCPRFDPQDMEDVAPLHPLFRFIVDPWTGGTAR